MEKNQIFSEIREKKSNKYIISSEGFCESDKILIPRLKDALKFFAIDFETKIIVYLRPQVSWFESSYQQIVKDQNVRTIKSFNEYIKLGYIYDYCDYYSHLNLWAKYFKKENIIVIPYDPMQHKAKLYTDFLTAINISNNLELKKPPPQKTNIGLSESTIEFLRWLNILKIDTHLFQEILAIFENNQNEQFNIYNFIDQEKSDEIAQFFEESNRLVALDFLKRDNGILFPEYILNKRSPSPIFIQDDIFIPENFIQHIEFIKSKNKKVLQNLYSQIYVLDSDAKKTKQQFLSLLDSILEKKKTNELLKRNSKFNKLLLILNRYRKSCQI